ncbi:MAG: CU044_2847 family protein [Methylophaga sp.]
MDTVIKLKDGIEFEVEVADGDYQQISTGSHIDKSIDGLKLMLSKVAIAVDDGLKGLSDSVEPGSATVTLGIKVGIDGNFFIAKSAVEANIKVEFKLGKRNG